MYAIQPTEKPERGSVVLRNRKRLDRAGGARSSPRPVWMCVVFVAGVTVFHAMNFALSKRGLSRGAS